MPKDINYKNSVSRERYKLLIELNKLMDKPMAILAFAWLVLIIIDLSFGLKGDLILASYFIWALFVLDFLVGFIIAPKRTKYLRRNWLTGISVLLPAFGILRLFRVGRFIMISRFTRSLDTLKLFTSTRRSVNAVRRVLKVNALGKILVFTIILMFAGAAGLFYFEKTATDGIITYWDALWWSSMILTTIGSDFWPVTLEGRLMFFFLSFYAFSFFGYLAASLASYFIEHKKK